MGDIAEEISGYLAPLLEGSDHFIVRVAHLPGNIIQVFLDGDQGITIDSCAKYNRSLQKILDENGLVGEKYVLEVSSPGIDQPLLLNRQYRKNIGRDIKVIYKNGVTKYGKLSQVDDEKIILSETKKISNRQRKINAENKNNQADMVEVSFSEIKQTSVVINISNK